MASFQFQTGHVGLNVTDLARSKQFYLDVFGFDVLVESEAEGRRYAFLTHDNTLVLTLWEQSNGTFASDRPGLHHLSFQVDEMAEVKRFENRLRELGIPLLYNGVVPHREGAASGGIFFHDPDGIRLEIYSPSGAEGRSAPVADGPTCGFF